MAYPRMAPDTVLTAELPVRHPVLIENSTFAGNYVSGNGNGRQYGQGDRGGALWES